MVRLALSFELILVQFVLKLNKTKTCQSLPLSCQSLVEQLGERYRYQSEADTASSWGDRMGRVVTRLVVCRREGVERMVVRC